MGKQYRLSADDVVPGLAGGGGCIVSDRVAVDGAPVGFMYCDQFGWNFLAGDEDEAYCSDSRNFSLVDLNYVANCDRAVVPFLGAPGGSAFIREGDGFVVDPVPVPPEFLS